MYSCEDGEYSVLVGVKNFSYSRIEHGKKVIDGKHGSGPFGIFNNPGQHVFPGGKSSPGESILKASLKEFEVETGIHFTVSFEMSEVDGKDIKYLNTKIGDMNIKCQHYIKKFDHYSCIYVNVPTKYDLGFYSLFSYYFQKTVLLILL
jgi:8-oxo-dGTP pyrophosphatase MutT (NUDIX family)